MKKIVLTCVLVFSACCVTLFAQKDKKEKEISNKTCFKKVSWRLSTPGSTQNAMAYSRTPCLFSCRTGAGPER